MPDMDQQPAQIPAPAGAATPLAVDRVVRSLQILACIGPLGLVRRVAEIDRAFERDIQAADADDAALGADGLIESGIDASDDDVLVPSPVRHRNTKAPMDTCLHEAGHAVAHWYVGIPFAQVSVAIRPLPGSPRPSAPHSPGW